ncbi:MAG: hypothetical protein ACI91O_001092 [Candidatus Poriferisodalaceae bacterium]|jgi:hypothetical protein
MGSVRADVRYINPEWRDRPDTPAIGDRESRHANTSYFEVEIRDARTPGLDLGLDESGFELTSAQPLTCGLDKESVLRDYGPAMLDLVARETGAIATYMWFHLVRTEDQSNFNTAYSRFVHCDFHVDRMAKMTSNLLGKNGVSPEPDWSYAWINTWQPFDHPVEEHPLAVIDVRSLAVGDLIDYQYTGYENSDGLVTAPVYSGQHEWFTFPSMALDEVLLTKQLEGRPGRAVQCPHTSFADPGSSATAAPRRSVETRVLAVFEAE